MPQHDRLNALPPQQRERAATLSAHIIKTLEAGGHVEQNLVNEMKGLVATADQHYQRQQTGHALPSAVSGGRNGTGEVRNDDMNQMIKDSAEANAHIADCAAKGITPDKRAIARVHELEAIARSSLSPANYQVALQQMNRIKAGMMGENRVRDDQKAQLVQDTYQAAQDKQRSEGLVRALRGVTGDGKFSTGTLETAEQLSDFRAGKKVTVKTDKVTLPKKAIAEQIREKFGTSLEQHKDKLDDLSQLKLTDPEQFKQQAAEYGIDEKTVSDWSNGGYLSYGLQERFAEQDKDMDATEEREPSKEDIMKMDLNTAAAEHDAYMHDPSLDDFKEDNAELLNESSRHGDIARSWAACEQIENENQE